METFELYWDEITAGLAVANTVATLLTVAWVLTIKKDPMSALAWCLVVIFVPVLGVLLFLFLGYQQVHRPVTRKARHKQRYRSWPSPVPDDHQASPPVPEPLESGWHSMARLAQRFGAPPPADGNEIIFYDEGQPAYEDMLAAIRAARHHIHMEFFIVQPDATGQRFLEALATKARQGVEVRLLYDAMGSHRLHRGRLRSIHEAGGRCCAFLPLDPLRRRLQINMRNHRKIVVVDGVTAFTGGLNIGDEYLGHVARFGYWRDTHLRVVGPLVNDLQRIFVEDWDFAAQEDLRQPAYFPWSPSARGQLPTAQSCMAQVIESGPDQPLKGIREIYYAAIGRARRRLWIATPYFVPDAGLRDALCLAGYQGVDVRLLCQFWPDKWIPYFAGRYYFSEVLDAGVKVYQYTKGMMHSKVMLVDSEWASVGTANLDNRSMHLNFEVNCLIYTPTAVADLEAAFRRDLTHAIQLDREVYAARPFTGRLIENACRLLSPVL